MSDRYESRADVWDKIQWEGGIMEALDYGIKTEDMPEGDTELAEAWARLETAFRALQPLAEAVEDLFEEGLA